METLNSDGSFTVTFHGKLLRTLEEFKSLTGKDELMDAIIFALDILKESQLKTIKIVDESTGDYTKIYPWKFNKPQWIIDKEVKNER